MGDATQAVAPSTSFWLEALVQLRLALPIAGANLLQRLLTWMTWACVGHLGADFLGPVTLASSVNNVLGTSVVGGLSMGISTLAAQAFGAKDHVALACILQRGILITLLGSAPCVLLLLVMKPLLLLLHMKDDFATRAGVYSHCVLLVTPIMGIQRAVAMWMVSQKVTTPRLVVQALSLPLHAALTWLLTFTMGLGYVGAGFAMSLSTAIQSAILYSFLTCSSTFKESWKGFSREALRGWGPFMKVAMPGVLMNAEYWVGESLTFAAGFLPESDTCLSALAIYQLTQTTCYQVPSGIRMAVTARIGNQLGAGQPERAALAQQAGLRLVLIWIAIPTVLLLLFTRQWGLIFTTDQEVLRMLATLVYCMLAYSNMDAVLAYYNGVLGACGQQSISGKWAVFGYVCIGFPLAIIFAFFLRWGVIGLVLGHCIGKLCHTLPCIAAVQRIRWREQSAQAIERVHLISNSARSPLAPVRPAA